MILLSSCATPEPLEPAVIPNPNGSQQPYIDSLVSGLPKESYTPTPDHQQPYIDKLRKQLGNEESSEGYSEKLKKQAGSDNSTDYAENIQKKLPPDHGSAIDDYNKGKKLHANMGDLTTSSAFGFNVALTTNRTYTAGANQEVAYDQVYGTGWIPDFNLHYESRPFPKSSFFGKFGLYAAAGTSFTHADGILDFVPAGSTFGNRARTEFKFIMIPVELGLIYRFNFLGFSPYFGAGPAAIGFIEQRNDEKPSHHGHDFGYFGIAGVAIGLDFLSSESTWEQYQSAAIKHSYFTIEYSYLSSFSGGLVEMTADGLNLGFTFEL